MHIKLMVRKHLEFWRVGKSHHFEKDGSLTEYDLNRQKIIQEKLNCQVIRIRDRE